MADVNDTFLILHGWGGNKPAHWQEHLNAALTRAGARVHYPKMPDPTAPDRAAWLARLDEELAAITSGPSSGTPLTVLGHSLGAITWLHHAARSTPAVVADRVLLVAPPYVIPEIPPTDAPPGVPGFFPPPLSAEGVARSGRETAIIATDSDDYATFEQTKAYADRLGVPIHLLPGAGHISPYWGYGEWPWVLEWCLRRADFPPQPRPAE
jgi:hypothetical protein